MRPDHGSEFFANQPALWICIGNADPDPGGMKLTKITKNPTFSLQEGSGTHVCVMTFYLLSTKVNSTVCNNKV
jgi:hypothetical protein